MIYVVKKQHKNLDFIGFINTILTRTSVFKWTNLGKINNDM